LAPAVDRLRYVEAVKSNIRAPLPTGEELKTTAVHECTRRTADAGCARLAAGCKSGFEILGENAAAKLAIKTNSRFSSDNPKPSVERPRVAFGQHGSRSERGCRPTSIEDREIGERLKIFPDRYSYSKARSKECFPLGADHVSDRGTNARKIERPSAVRIEQHGCASKKTGQTNFFKLNIELIS